MKCSNLSIANLDQFVAEVDSLVGVPNIGPDHQSCTDFVKGFNLEEDVSWGKRLDPFGSEYMSRMIDLYERIAGKKLDQRVGELFGVPDNVELPNPYGTSDVHFMARHSRAITDSILAAELPPSAKILDMGCGWGLSTEIFGFSGAQVTAVDINSNFIELVKARCSKQNIAIETHVCAFDEVETETRFDAIFFYECMHHAVDLNGVIAHVRKLLAPGGKIVFAGEPINAIWWKHWGLRLDPMSIYCIRNFGWFESGWSHAFLQNVFDRNSLDYSFHNGIGLDGAGVGIGRALNK